MAMTPQLFTLHALSTELGRDFRLLARALANTPPDAVNGRHKCWRLRTALAALSAHGYPADRGVSNGSAAGGRSDLDLILAELEAIARHLEVGFGELAAEPDLMKRRERGKVIGPLVGRLADALQRSAEAVRLRSALSVKRSATLWSAKSSVSSCVCASGTSRNPAERHASCKSALDHLGCKLRLGRKANVARHVRRPQASRIVGPALRQIERPIDEGMAVTRHVGSKKHRSDSS